MAMAIMPGSAGGRNAMLARKIRAYHGSPHDFDKFDLSKIGTGEGAQAYGHGLYFAENEAVAKGYRDALGNWPTFFRNELGHDVSDEAVAAMQQTFAAYPDDIGRAVASAKMRSPELRDVPDADLHRALQGFAGRDKPGRMYEVEIDADPAQFLDWDAPLSGQPEAIQRAYLDARYKGNPEYIERSLTDPDYMGRSAGSFMYDLQHPSVTGSPEAASRALAERGIPGIKYLDAGSRGPAKTFDVGSPREGFGPYSHYTDEAAAQRQLELLRSYGFDDAEIKTRELPQSRNYVTFRDDIVKILRKYGVASISALPPAVQLSLALKQSGEEPPDTDF